MKTQDFFKTLEKKLKSLEQVKKEVKESEEQKKTQVRRPGK